MNPAKIKILLQDAVTHHRAGRLAEAEKLYARVRAVAPASFDAWHLSGTVAQQLGRSREAVELLRRALRLNPASAICEMRLGAACLSAGDLAAAEKHLRGAVACAPEIPEAWCQLGALLKVLNRPADARAAYERALALRPGFDEAHDRLAALIAETEGFVAAVPLFRRAVERRPRDPAALASLGVALAQSASAAEALSVLERALAVDPANELALTGRALALQETYRIPEAVAAYGDVIARNPRSHDARSGRLLAQHYLDDVTHEELFAEHAAFGAAVGEPAATRTLPNPPEPGRRLRVGFLSPDLRAHSVAYFLEPLLAHLDRTQFEIFLYHDHPRVDAMSARLRAHAAAWRHVAGWTPDAVEAGIRADAPDVLIDLAGHTGLNRLPLFARRLAPVQATYLGYPDTTGLRAMDFRFVDAVTDPAGDAEAFHTERLVRFAPTAWSYAPPADAPAVAPGPGAAGGPVTFGCFNNFAKVSDATLRGWAQVLQAVPEARLLLKGLGLTEAAVATRVYERFAQLGVAAGRVELLGRTPGLAAHLALYARVDVALDTFPYHGTTTTCEALWMGRPVVTLRGDRHASRVGASLLTAAGHPEWIARDWDEYARLAGGLAKDAAEHPEKCRGLRDTLRASPLLDHAGQAARFGAALRECWAGWCAGWRRSAA